jgi:hypothetical protein
MRSTTRMTGLQCAIVLTITHLTAACFAFPVSYHLVDSPFTDVSGPYTTSDFISGFFTIDIPGTTSLADYANLSSADRTFAVDDFAFNDGVKTFTPSDGPFSSAFLFEFSTDGSSNVKADDYLIQLAVSPSDIIAPGSAGSQAISGAFNSNPLGEAFNIDGPPGVWTIVPEPNTLLLGAMATVGLLIRRRKD